MKKKRKFKRVLSIAMCSLLMVPAYLPSVASAENNSVSTSYYGEQKNLFASKISPRLSNQFNNNEMVTFLIKFKEQVDSEKVAAQAAQKALVQKSTAVQTTLMKRNAIVSELRATALETQGGVTSFLEKAEAEGIAKGIQSFYIVNGMAVTATKEVMEKIASFPEVEKVLPNETRQLYASSGNSASGAVAAPEKAVPNTANVEWNIDKVGAPAVWDMGIDGTGVVVASIDTGVQWNHPSLKEKYRGFDPSNPNSPSNQYNWLDATTGQSTPYDDHSHGTHVTGTMVGSEPNGSNKIGVAPGAKWIAVKAFTEDGGTDADILEAGEWILAPKDASGNPNPAMAPDIVNNSWGGGPGLDEWYRPMVQAWRAADIFPEFSAGNTTLTNPGGPGSVAAPGNYPEAFTTGATDINNGLGNFSLQGPSPYGLMKPDISAPGVNIRSSIPGGTYEGGWNGTSMAGPHISAVVALLKQVNASLTIEQIEDIITSTATPLTNSQYPNSPNNGFGYGLVNAYDAVSSIISGLGTLKGQVGKAGEDTVAPTYEHTAPSETFAGMALPLSINVKDNVSISTVTLQYLNQAGEWVNAETTRTAGTYNEATYRAAIPADEIAVPTLSYRWHISDYGQNDVTTDTYVVNVAAGITTGYFQNFETTPAGWYSFGTKDTWQWGVPKSGPNGAFSGEKVYATNLSGNYDNNANMTLVMPPVDLPAEGPSYLQFMKWNDIETRYDFGHVFVSTDQSNWTQLLRFDGKTTNWEAKQVDLSSYAGQRIYIGFNVKSDGSVPKAGLYIDDVRLTNVPLTVQGKGSLSITPEKTDDTAVLKTEKVDPDKIRPEGSITDFVPVTGGIAPNALPVQAKVSVIESGRSVTTNPANGQFELTHAAGVFTVKAEAYGYQSVTQSVNIQADGEAVANFVLEEIEQGTVSGTVTNEATGQPIVGAKLVLVEDAHVAPVVTDENGHYSITAFEGTYTLKVMAPSYYSNSFEVVIDGQSEQTLQLRPFIGYPGEIGYDNGTAENARAFNAAGNGWAVKMTLPEGQDSALVSGGLFRFWDTAWPVPGGTEFKVEVYDASGPGGAPGNKLAGPFDATALRNGQWTQVDLSEHGITVGKDFYMVYIQTKANPNSPGLGADEDGPNAGRSWQVVGGVWTPSPEEEGNYMIRALVSFAVNAPVLVSPVNGSFTNQSTVTVTGKSSPTTTVHLFNNGVEVGTAAATNDGTFSVDVNLTNGENRLTAKAATASGVTGESAPITIVLDQVAPELSITSPENGSKTNKDAVTVTGTVQDTNLTDVEVNGQKATVTNGTFSKKILVENGENVITVVANDKAGNVSTSQVTIDVKAGAIAISGVKPDVDKYVKAGESVDIEFTSEPGLNASFTIHLPLTNGVAGQTELPLQEVSPGVYKGTWTALNTVIANGAQIEVIAKDSYGNEARQVAAGKLFINFNAKPDRPGRPNR